MSSPALSDQVAAGRRSNDRVAVLGIRHHGPGSARSVLAELDRLQPELVLIEGPADATGALLELAADEQLQPPVALLAYAPDEPRVSAFWPFATFSPEWQAIRWAVEHQVEVRFCDLPTGMVLATEPPDEKGQHDKARTDQDGTAEGETAEDESAEQRPTGLRQDPIALLAGAAGYDDPERWWDDVVEARLGGAAPFEAITEAMAELRADPPTGSAAEQLREQRREAQMRQVLRAALKGSTGTVAVICGAWHAPALTAPLPPATADAALLRGAAKRKTALTWVPWTHSRLAAASGYGAGVDSPGWYHHLFTVTDQPITRWLTRVAGVLRQHDLPVSSAHVIEAVRLAETLAVLRGRPLAGLAEVSEATRAVLCDGDEVAAAFVSTELVIGEALGTVPEHAPAVPLEIDLRKQAKTLRLKLDPVSRTQALDLRKDTDRARSVLFHRLVALNVHWAELTADQVRGSGTFHETWNLQWQPELSIAVIDAAQWGATVAAAASAKLTDTAAKAAELATVTAAVEQVLLAELPDALPGVLAALDRKAAQDADVAHLMTAIPALVRAVRYGDVRGTDTGALIEVIDALTIRVCAGLPAAVSSLADDAADQLRQRLDAVHAALSLHAQDEAQRSPHQRWLTVLGQLAGRRDVHGLLTGRIVRILLDAGRIERAEAADRFSAHLSVGVSAADKAAWSEGFLSGSGLLLVHDRDLLAVLDGWLASLNQQDFLDVLPLLRRTFGSYNPAERSNIGDAARQLGAGTAKPTVIEQVDARRAAGALRTVAAILRGPR